MTNYIIYKIIGATTLEVSFDGTLDADGVYKFNELECECYGVAELGGSGSTVVTIKSSYTSGALEENGIECLADTTPCIDFEKDLIIEDDVNLYMSKKMNINEIINNIKTSVIISNGTDTYTLYSYNIPTPNTYVGGYLVYNAVIEMDWINFFPEDAINNKAVINTTGDTIELLLPNLINWRYFQSLPQLVSIFGTDATNNWRWYEQNGWSIYQRVEVETPDGNYINNYQFSIRDYDDNAKINWNWEFFKVSDNTQLTVPVSNEPVKVIVTGDMPLNTTVPIDYATVTVENFEGNIRWLISSFYNQNGQNASPLEVSGANVKLDLLNIVGVNNSFKLEFVLDPSKLENNDGIKFTARVYELNSPATTGEYTERNKIEFPLPKLPEPKRPLEFESDCCDCLPEIKLASSTSEDIMYNDITGVVHKNQSDTDTCVFEMYKDGELLINNGVSYDNGFPNDILVSAFVYNWKYYILNHGSGCYKIIKNYTVAGVSITDEIGVYNLEEYSPENSEATARILYQNDFETLYNDDLINYTGSGFQDSYRFRGMFGQWQPNVFSESNFSVTNENRVSSIKSKDTYILNHFDATECHVNRLVKITMTASLWRVSDHNRNNTLQDSLIYDCVLDNENKSQINYNVGSRVTGIEIILSKRQQNSVSLFSGSVQLVKGASWFFPSVSGTVTCDKDLFLYLNYKDTNDIVEVLGDVNNIGAYTVIASGLTYSTDGVTYIAIPNPFTIVSATQYYFKRGTPTTTEVKILQGTYV